MDAQRWILQEFSEAWLLKRLFGGSALQVEPARSGSIPVARGELKPPVGDVVDYLRARQRE